ncbi:long-chain acyl-CoA synthetase [Pseudonocardia thermophila]|uniref:Acyl-CoA synthetase n=1 Tax=Pseudonocardia thermophila TaxID=1848 RepID=A0A1M6NQX5_PSETH|nr:AMP-dependent synthetase/ligase [Pseudonocardia thermophila]SHJ98119.1 long-chain acyl-CoA synthetase [Pseudonocardia thermophila]
MREYSVPATFEVAADENLVAAVYTNARVAPGSVGVRRRDAAKQWHDMTYAEFAKEVTDVARGLIASGVKPGDRVALLSHTRYEWTLFDYAILAVGGITVPIYETSSADQISWILSDSGAVGIIVENAGHMERLDQVKAALGSLPQVWQIDAGVVDELKAKGAEVPEDQVHERRSAVGADDLATLIYTSGTTGRPKGCELTHRNLLSEIKSVATILPTLLQEGGSVLLFLPLAHVFGKVIQCGAVYKRTVIGHTPDIAELVDDLQSFKPTFLLAVPRVFEKVYNAARQKAHDEGKGKIFDTATDVAIAWSRAQDSGGPSLGLRLKHALFDKLVYAKLRAVTGGRVVAAVSGSAPLGERLGHYFRGIGLPVLEGYGLTETSAGVTVNTLDAQRVGSVGRPVPGHAVRIADDGEILLKGPIVFRGYWNNEAATKEAFTDDWFHSGDIGELDDAGFLYITGRKKELIVTAGGKNVAPAVLEDRLRSHVIISQAMVVGDNKPFIGAVITIDQEALPRFLRNAGRPEDTPLAELVDDPLLRAEVQKAVDDANSQVSRAEQIREFRILPVDFTEEGGEMTPSMKVKRAVVAKKYAEAIESIYAKPKK